MLTRLSLISAVFLFSVPLVAEGTCVFATQTVWTRSAPSFDAPQVSSIPKGYRALLLEEIGEPFTFSYHTGKWARVRYFGKEQFVFGGYLQDQIPANSLAWGWFKAWSDSGGWTVESGQANVLWDRNVLRAEIFDPKQPCWVRIVLTAKMTGSQIDGIVELQNTDSGPLRFHGRIIKDYASMQVIELLAEQPGFVIGLKQIR